MKYQTPKHISLSLISSLVESGGDGSVSLWLEGATMDECKVAVEKIAKFAKQEFPQHNWEPFHFKTDFCEYWGVHSQEQADLAVSPNGFIFENGEVSIKVWKGWFNVESL
jgi:hypothetical protein